MANINFASSCANALATIVAHQKRTDATGRNANLPRGFKEASIFTEAPKPLNERYRADSVKSMRPGIGMLSEFAD
jgi:hypothetical protein